MKTVKGYFLSTCGWCRKTKSFLEANNVDYDYDYVDLVAGEEKTRILEEVDKWNPRRSFPTVVVSNDDTVVVIGFKEDRLREVLGL